MVKTKYDECIFELQKGGKFYDAWIICCDGGDKLPGGDNPNSLGHFMEVLNRLWMNGSALLFWNDNYTLTYESNLYFRKSMVSLLVSKIKSRIHR